MIIISKGYTYKVDHIIKNKIIIPISEMITHYYSDGYDHDYDCVWFTSNHEWYFVNMIDKTVTKQHPDYATQVKVEKIYNAFPIESN